MPYGLRRGGRRRLGAMLKFRIYGGFMKVYVSADLPRDLAERLSRAVEVVGRDRMGEAEAALCFRITPEELKSMQRLRFLQVITAGLDHLPWEAIPPHVVVAGNAGSNADAVAEFAVAMALGAYKRVIHYDRRMKRGEYGRDVGIPMAVGSKAAVLGLGEIGTRVAKMLAALGLRVYGFSRTRKEGPWVFTSDLLEAMAGARIAVSALPLNKHTRGLVKYQHLAAMDGEGVFVNVGRAEVVERGAVERILRERPGFTFASDVWWSRSDFAKDADIISLPNVVATPWVAGGYGNELVWRRMLEEAVDNLLRWVNGETPRNIARREDYV
jgi:Lactate dehydrogenase and related dehydrogenases